MKRALGLGLAVLALSACPSTGVVCRAGTDRCGNGCSDFQSDSRNCGSCGKPCLGTQVCSSGQCLCREGTTLCDGQCVVIENDPKNCGGCGAACAAGLVCFNKTCGQHCPDAGNYARCGGGSCTQLTSDALNCGACGNACPDSQSCRGGQCTWDLVAACFSTGQLAGLQSGSDRRGPLVPMGSGPISLAQYGGVVLVGDGIDNRVVQAKLPSLAQLGNFNATGAGLNQVLVDAPYVYAVNSTGHTVQVLAATGDAGCAPQDAGCAVVALSDGGLLQPLMGDGGCFVPAPSDGGCAQALLADGGLGPLVPEEDAGCFTVPPVPVPMCSQTDGGVTLRTVGAVDTGMSTFPQAAVKVGSALFVPLWGDLGAGAAAGQKVLKIDVSNPASPNIVGTVDLTTLDLHPFDAGVTPTPRPYAVVEQGGKVWVALNNTTDGLPLTPRGPGLLVQIDPATLATRVFELGGAVCQNALAIAVSGGKLFVSCGGGAKYDMSFRLVENAASGVVAFDPADGGRTAWSPACPAVNDGGCLVPLPSRLVVRDGRVYLGDQNGGRIFVADVQSDGTLTERRGYAPGAQSGPIQACGVDLAVGFSNVADIISLP